jgi:hypothetical protein
MSMKDIQSELKAPKGQFNSFGKYKYRSCEDIVEAAKPVLFKHGCHLNLSDDMVQVSDRVYVKATATVLKGDVVIGTSTAFARESLDKKGMDDSQITGTASSYARKYALNGLFAIDDTKDADTNEHKQQETLPPPTAAHIKAFGNVNTLEELKSLWEGLSKEEREICAGIKELAKIGLR